MLALPVALTCCKTRANASVPSCSRAASARHHEWTLRKAFSSPSFESHVQSGAEGHEAGACADLQKSADTCLSLSCLQLPYVSAKVHRGPVHGSAAPTELFRQSPPPAGITTINMPRTGAFQATRRIAASKRADAAKLLDVSK